MSLQDSLVPRIDPSPALRLCGVAKRYPRFQLGPLDFELEPGMALALLGVNGGGKSTLLRILLGLLRPDSGTVEVLGLPMPEREHDIKAEVGFVSEDMGLYGQATIAWHLDFARSLSPRWDEAYARELLGRFVLDPGQAARGLSKGQQMRLLLLLALARRPRLLLLDEPTSGLDPRIRHEVREELAGIIRTRQTAMIFSSHLTEDAAALADEVAFLHEGRIVRRAPTRELLAEGSLKSVFLHATASLSEERLEEVCA